MSPKVGKGRRVKEVIDVVASSVRVNSRVWKRMNNQVERARAVQQPCSMEEE